MLDDLKTLLELQEKDRAVMDIHKELDALEPELAELDRVIAALEEELEAARGRVTAAAERRESLEGKIESYRVMQERRRQNIHLLAYNTRFLILPWGQVPRLASHLLSRLARQLSRDWEELYHHPIYLLETFIDPGRFAGTCYRAANWIYLGMTTGRGKDDLTHRANRPLKQLWVYPLGGNFRAKLTHES